MTEDGVTHTISSFLQRPVCLTTGKWTTSEPMGKLLYSTKLPRAVMQNKMYITKLNNLLGLRADFKIRVQVNSQPFQAGRLLLSWIPFLSDAKNNGLQHRNVYYNAKDEKNLPCLTGSPRTEIDLSTTTEATLDIPYISPFSYYNIVSGKSNIGKFQLVVYSPLKDVVASGELDYTVWLSMHNVKAEFPTGMPSATISTIAQVGNEAASMEQTGLVESTANKFSRALNVFNDIPLLSSYIKPAVWTSDRVADIAKIFGWSKPHSLSDISLVAQNTARYMTNYDGIDMSTNMAFSSSNEIETTPGLFRTDADEMSISHIVRTPGYFAKFDWAKTDAPNKSLFSHYINPAFYSLQLDNAEIVAPTHLSYMSQHFLLWRGGINFTFKFVKTKFHSGRVRIAFIPACMDKTKVSDVNLDANYSTVVDLRSQTEIVFNVPFVSVVPWLQCHNLSQTGPLLTTTTGVINVSVLNELVPVNTVSDTIQVLVEVAGAEDFEFAIPVEATIAPYVPKTTTTTDSSTAAPKGKRSIVDILTVAQVGAEEVEPVSHETLQRIGTSVPAEVHNHRVGTDFTICANTVGEKVTSVRQLIKRFSRTFKIAPSEKCAALRIFPTSFSSPVEGTDANIDAWSEEVAALDHFAYLYAFYRGSTRYKIFQTPFTKSSYSYLLPGTFGNYSSDTGFNVFKASSIPAGVARLKGAAKVHIPQLDGTAELSVPFYSMYPFNVVNSGDTVGIDATNNGYRGFNSTVYYPKDDSARIEVYAAAGDDFSFAFLLGPPWIKIGPSPPNF
nr:MAG: hypothetical protein 2 [Dicistroviridae sp.]